MTAIPLADASRRPSRLPVVTTIVIIANAVVFGLELTGGEPFVMRWSVIPADITAGHHWITLLTSLFMHAGWSHIVGNMIFFWAFGPQIEDAMGPIRYLVFYLTGGLVAGFAQIAVDPHSTIPNLGASGAIAAVMGAFLVTYPRDRIRTLVVFFVFVRVTFVPAVLLIGLWFLSQLISVGAIASGGAAAAQSGGVAYLAHIGGMVYGALTARWFEYGPRRATPGS